MRQVIMTTMLTIGVVSAFLNCPAQAQYAVCIPARGCAPATQASYNACFNLALARGESVAWGERRRLDWFIYQCLAGRIPR